MRLILLATVGLATLACDGGRPDQFIELHGQWADGQAIDFFQEAVLSENESGRIILAASDSLRPRFLGVRIDYDPTLVAGPGPYVGAATETGPVVLHVLRSVDQYAAAEYFVKNAAFDFTSLPTESSPILAGTLGAVNFIFDGAPVLAVKDGAFRGVRR